MKKQSYIGMGALALLIFGCGETQCLQQNEEAGVVEDMLSYADPQYENLFYIPFDKDVLKTVTALNIEILPQEGDRKRLITKWEKLFNDNYKSMRENLGSYVPLDKECERLEQKAKDDLAAAQVKYDKSLADFNKFNMKFNNLGIELQKLQADNEAKQKDLKVKQALAQSSKKEMGKKKALSETLAGELKSLGTQIADTSKAVTDAKSAFDDFSGAMFNFAEASQGLAIAIAKEDCDVLKAILASYKEAKKEFIEQAKKNKILIEEKQLEARLEFRANNTINQNCVKK